MAEVQPKPIEVMDVDIPPTRVTPAEAAFAIINGKLGWFSQVRATSTQDWKYCARIEPYAYLLPMYVPKHKSWKSDRTDFPALIHLCPTYDKIISKSKELRASGELKEGGFYVPIGFKTEHLLRTKMFEFGKGVFAAPLLLPYQVKSPGKASLYLVVANASSKEATCDLGVESRAGFMKGHAVKVPKEELKMSVLPGKTLTKSIPIDIVENLSPREYILKVICKVSTKELVAKAAAAYVASAAAVVAMTMLTGGGAAMIPYNTGKGFFVKFQVAKETT